jgi:hypothetical protein
MYVLKLHILRDLLTYCQVNPQAESLSKGRAASIISSISVTIFGRSYEKGDAVQDSGDVSIKAPSVASVADMPHLAGNEIDGSPSSEAALDSPGSCQAEPSIGTQGSTATQAGLGSESLPEDEPDDEDDDEDNGCSDMEGLGNAQDDERHKIWLAPSVNAAAFAHAGLNEILHPRRKNDKGYLDPKLDLLLQSRLEGMKRFLWNYTNPASSYYGKWTAASLDTATASEKGPWFARRLREWSSAFIDDPKNLPHNVYGTWNKSCLEDEDLKQEILLHLQSIGKYISAMDIVRYLDQPDVQKWHGFKKTISERTAQTWLKNLGYRWKLEPSGQYVDGHKRKDVTDYRQNVFLPRWKDLEYHMRAWTKDGVEEPDESPHPRNHRVVVWFHDESTFYANDRWKKRWVHESEKAVPQTKGEGASLMVSDFVSAEYGWLRSPDGKESARVLFKAGKARDGYFTNEDILQQTEAVMDIVSKHYPDEDHIFVFDNAPTHLKRAENAISSHKMMKGPSRTFGVEVTDVDEMGKIKYAPDGKPRKKAIQMGPGQFADGTPQPFYDESGVFKGMTKILQERSLHNESKLNAECKGFKCKDGETQCCQRQVLFNQPDFVQQESVLESRCKARGFDVLFLPKFHCELNFIEQCWGHAKHVYRQYPPSSKEANLEANVLSALESVAMETMRR